MSTAFKHNFDMLSYLLFSVKMDSGIFRGAWVKKTTVLGSMNTYSTNACAKLSILSLSRLVVGSSKARIPQLRQKVSANARRMSKDARTYTEEINNN